MDGGSPLDNDTAGGSLTLTSNARAGSDGKAASAASISSGGGIVSAACMAATLTGSVGIASGWNSGGAGAVGGGGGAIGVAVPEEAKGDAAAACEPAAALGTGGPMALDGGRGGARGLVPRGAAGAAPPGRGAVVGRCADGGAAGARRPSAGPDPGCVAGFGAAAGPGGGGGAPVMLPCRSPGRRVALRSSRSGAKGSKRLPSGTSSSCTRDATGLRRRSSSGMLARSSTIMVGAEVTTDGSSVVATAGLACGSSKSMSSNASRTSGFLGGGVGGAGWRGASRRNTCPSPDPCAPLRWGAPPAPSRSSGGIWATSVASS